MWSFILGLVLGCSLGAVMMAAVAANRDDE